MSLSSLSLRAGFLSLALLTAGALAGCTFTQALQNESAVHAMALGFAPPNNPAEQLVYQDLGTKFGVSDTPDAPQVSVTVTTYSRALAQSQTTDVAKNMLMTAAGVLRITKDGQQVLVTTRQATATYNADSQVLGDKSAETAAQEQAAHALADTLELTILSALTPRAPAAGQ